MKTFTVFVLTVICVLQISATISKDEKVVHQRGFETIGDTAYYIGPVGVNVDVKTAIELCNDAGMNLVNLETEEEDQLINQFLVINDYSGSYWTGGRRLQDSFHWSSGQRMNYTNWKVGEPSSFASTEQCINFSVDAGWNDDPCVGIRRFMCEASCPSSFN